MRVLQDTVLAINLTCPDGMGTEEYSQHAKPLLQLLQIAYEVQLADMEELELRVESTHSLEQVSPLPSKGLRVANGKVKAMIEI